MTVTVSNDNKRYKFCLLRELFFVKKYSLQENNFFNSETVYPLQISPNFTRFALLIKSVKTFSVFINSLI